MKELVVPAKPEHFNEVLAFVDGELTRIGCEARAQCEILVAVEEIFVNIFSYAYPPKEGDATIRMEIAGNPAVVRIDLIDQGKPYDPLQREDPDITLSAEERKIGGLGIYMVKQSMDNVTYRYENGSNILTLYKTVGKVEQHEA